MKTSPLLFNGPMVRALLEGRKTQTRRIMELQPTCNPDIHPAESGFHGPKHRDCVLAVWPGESEFDYYDCHCPYGQPGDLIWVRENIYVDTYLDAWYSANLEINDFGEGSYVEAMNDRDWEYREPEYTGTIPSIHMPRWASRLTLQLTDVRVERVQDISGPDALAEGVLADLAFVDIECPDNTALVEMFECIWTGLYGWDSWVANPWVWALTFETIKKNVDDVVREYAA